MPNPPTSTTVNLTEVREKSRIAREIVSYLDDALPSMAELWRRIYAALADTLMLIVEINRLNAANRLLRDDCANLLAAARATLGAADEGTDPDPLYYVRDEVNAQQQRHRDGA
ncbi:hypothetical protein [Actinomadura harenae]|uniref:Uncharacterized protein n=1 Tax=Actinomadura harenae TaxID=2483351 RepID=A0A3M2M2V8_9ACTN|nr:hypothetical protein [Actinomadura harenae]RMI44074.1 hypothetical protein EBO15_14235 [Actinomadura harenae]